MFGIGGFELFVIILFGLLIFGPDKMPQLGRTIGRTMRQFNKVQDDMKRVVTAEMYSKDPDKSTSPFKPQGSVLDKYAEDDEAEKVVGSSAPAQPAAQTSTSQADLLYGLGSTQAIPSNEMSTQETQDTPEQTQGKNDSKEAGEQ